MEGSSCDRTIKVGCICGSKEKRRLCQCIEVAWLVHVGEVCFLIKQKSKDKRARYQFNRSLLRWGNDKNFDGSRERVDVAFSRPKKRELVGEAELFEYAVGALA